jgi:hypothetical protein
MRKRHHKEAPSVAVNPTAAAIPARVVAPSDPNQRRQRATADEIRVLAYHKWVSAGQPEGDGAQFWVDAEQELLNGK